MTTDAPWLRRPDWAAGRIASTTRGNLRGAWLFAVLWNLVSAPILVFIPRELARKPVAAVGLLFPIVGVGLLVWAVTLTLRWRRFGPASFEMTPTPASPGGVLAGRIHTRLDQSRTASLVVTLRLTCLRRTVTRRADSNDTHKNVSESIAWREEQDVPFDQLSFTPMGTSIPVFFTLPADAEETSTIGRSSGIFWVLTADADIPGVDLAEDFEVPVYRVEGAVAGPPEGGPSVRPYAPSSVRPVTVERLALAGIDVKQTPGGVEYHFSRARNIGFALGTTAFLLLWTGMVGLLWYLNAPWLFAIVFGLFELILLMIVADLWSGSTTVVVSRRDIRRRRSVLGLGGWRTIPCSEIADLSLNINMQTSGARGTPYYEVRATLKNGRRCGLGDGIRNKRHAEWLLAHMQQESGIRNQESGVGQV